MNPRLTLFDIDATLLVTAGAGVAAMRRAGEALFGPGFTSDGLDFSGRLDPLLMAEMLELNGRAASSENLRTFRERYIVELHHAADRNGGRLGHALPGVHDLLDRLRESDSPIGLLTGNYAETGSLKLRCCGIDPCWFDPAVWGDDSPYSQPKRDHLPAVAIRRMRDRMGIELPAERVTIVGDTPHDVRCAKVNGCRSVGVATGKYSMDQLRQCGADIVLPDLSDVGRVTEILLADEV
ncbi:MAG: HAD family hydrolase [Phycisphaerales bacterium]